MFQLRKSYTELITEKRKSRERQNLQLFLFLQPSLLEAWRIG